jgi:branched-chain amino acid transport system substrate-binding protein
MELAIDALTRAASLDHEAIRLAIEETDLDTIVGHIAFNDKNYCETAVVGGQWIKTGENSIEIQLIENTSHPEIPITGQAISLQK